MLIRIRRRIQIESGLPLRREAASVVGALLIPSALAAFTMAFWSMAATLRWTGDFVISRGMLSHWEVWLTASAVLLLSGHILMRYAGGGEPLEEKDQSERI